MDELKICKDCKHYTRYDIYKECKRTKRTIYFSKVNGRVLTKMSDCLSERRGNCGEQAVYFEGNWKYKLKQVLISIFKRKG